MGADLITYMLLGPTKLTISAAKRKRILKHANTVIDLARRSVEADPTPKERKSVAGRLLNGLESEELRDIGEMDAATTLDELCQLWDGEFRDCSFRAVTIKGTRYRMVIAGDMSWGDEPEGEGYLAARRAAMLGLFPLLGIQ